MYGNIDRVILIFFFLFSSLIGDRKTKRKKEKWLCLLNFSGSIARLFTWPTYCIKCLLISLSFITLKILYLQNYKIWSLNLIYEDLYYHLELGWCLLKVVVENYNKMTPGYSFKNLNIVSPLKNAIDFNIN